MAEISLPRVAIVGGESLLGREVRELIGAIKPEPTSILISGEAESSQLARGDEGDAIVLTPMSSAAFEGVNAVMLCGTAESSRRAFELTEPEGTTLIDLTGALEDNGNARLRAPVLEPVETERSAQHIHVIAHPAAVSLALFYARLASRWRIQRSVVNVFEPASERGQRGLYELQTQTINLLSFKPLPKEVFDAQAGFNLLPAYGEEAPEALEQSEARIERHLATLLLMTSQAPMPSVRLVQAPVFHGYSASVWIEFAETPEVEDLEGALASAHIEVRGADVEPPTNVGIAGQSGLAAGNIRRDRNNAHAYWFWLAADNIRNAAETAVSVLKECL